VPGQLSCKSTIKRYSLPAFYFLILYMSDSRFLAALGARIKELRQKKGLTQNELAILCNFEKASMSRIESGRTNITMLTLKKISKALDVGLIEFFNDGVN
jgi:DNA-binding XRE family transcriptional regulator